MRYDPDGEYESIEKIRTRAINFRTIKAPTRPCPSGKTRHTTKKRALSSLAVTINLGHAAHLRIYKCPMCHDFHLTSQKVSKKKRA